MEDMNMARKSEIADFEWLTILDDYQDSGLSATAWCHKHSIKVHQLRYRLSRQNQLKAKELSTGFVGITLSDPAQDSSITLVVKDIKIIIETGFNKHLLGEILNTLSVL